ncbi:MAG: hypothetical protein ACFCVF_07960 [Kineosporiaceae bacterium]
MDLTGQRVLVVGSAGAQGSGLVPAVRARGGVPVRVTSSDARAQELRAAGDEAVVADLADSDALTAAAADTGAAAVAGIMPLAFGNPERGPLAIASYLALRSRGLPVVVNVGTPVPPPGVPDVMGGGAVSRALADGGVAVVAPTGYLENHVAPWSLATLAQGELVYPRPAGDVVAWTAATDMGTAAMAALAGDLGGQVLQLAGPQPLTFTELVGELGAGLNRELTFRQLTPAEYGDLLRPFLGDAAAAGVEQAYAAMPPGPSPLLNPAGAGEQWQRLGAAPTAARDWAARVLRPALEGFTAQAPA